MRTHDGILPSPKCVVGANFAIRLAAIRDLQFDPTLGPSPTSLRGLAEICVQDYRRAEDRRCP